ncbi:MAG: cytochrome c oxidase subunit II [Salinibacter sp.]|uniref:cytochrome c oxidase subunit II n=1 Tax=Salinibacter sp. TaxID=2065818 RepID=UPI0035D400D6
MHVHRFEKLWIGLSLFLIASFIGIVLFGFTVMDLKVPGVEQGKPVDPTTVLSKGAFANPGVRKIEENHYEVYMVAQQFLFRPGTGQPLVLPADTKVTFHLTSPDVIHGFEVPGTNLNSMVIPGQIATFTTRFPEPKTYGLICHEYCGAAHHNMKGEIKIVPKSEFDESNLISR